MKISIIFTVTSPAISFLMSVVSHFMTTSSDSHWDVGNGLHFEDRGHKLIFGYADVE